MESFALRGWGRCAVCSFVLRARAPMPGASVRHAGWYCCARGCAPHARQDHVDAEVERLVLARLEELRGLLAQPAPPPKVAPDLTAARARAVARLDRLVDAVGDGTIPRELARAKVAKVEAEIAEIDRRRAAAEGPPTAPARDEQRRTVEGLRTSWSSLAAGQRRDVLHLLAARVELAREPGAAKWSRGTWRLTVTWRET